MLEKQPVHGRDGTGPEVASVSSPPSGALKPGRASLNLGSSSAWWGGSGQVKCPRPPHL